ncbi:MAG: hypothetical protein JXQ83_05085 [Candidatus Glassbacteria bacterium]|nr:hypothetical protein [Candidatus Glassbacteria bacterium]
MKPLRILLLFASSARNRTLSYQAGWPRHFARHPLFRCSGLNLEATGVFDNLRKRLILRLRDFEAVVILHSVFSNSCLLSGKLLETVKALRVPKIFFIGNEYKLMPEKMEFCEKLGLALLISQSNSPEVHRLYRERLGCQVAEIPNTGLDTGLFCPGPPLESRPVDLGYRSARSPLYLGHDERTRIVEFFQEYGPSQGLVVDLSLDPARRFSEKEWAVFLGRCKGQLGTEAGGDCFELDDRTRHRINSYVNGHPGTAMEEVFELFFRDYRNPVPLRIISGRNVEAAGTKTVQILFEGRYSGYLQPDVHYIPLKKDFSNIAEAMTKFRDRDFCRELTENAFELASREFTYEKLIEKFYHQLKQIL